MNNNQDGYKMLDKVHLFTKSKGAKNKYLCPNCGKNDFEVKPSDGTYTCWSGGCEPKDIRSAIDALEGRVFTPGKAKEPAQKWVKPIRPKSSKEYFYPDRDGNQLIKVLRVDPGNGDKKKFPQFHWNGFAWANGNPDEFKVNVPIYRYTEVRQAIDRDSPVFVVEGESAADALWAIGIAATTTIGGAGQFAKYGDYTADFDGGKFVLAPDCDTPGIKHITEITAFLGDKVHGYYLAGSNPDLWIDPAGGFDIKDDITDRHLDRDRILASVISADEYRKILNPVPSKPVVRRSTRSAIPVDRDYQQLAKGLGVELPESHTDDRGIPTSKQFKLELDLFAVCGDRLGINEMSSEVELDRVRIDLNNAKSDVCRLLGTDHSTESCIMAFNQVAKVNRYSPVIEYLNSVRGLANKDFIRNIPAKYWNNNNDFQNYLFYRKMIATVARGMNPGCEDQSLLVLKGNQGARKSSLLQALASKNWFCGGGFDIESKDDLAKLSKFWILEMGEIDQLFSKKAAEQYKRFISEGFDVYRPPYGRMNVTKNRSSSLFATTNKSEFLNDPTGSRRYWIVECDEVIDLESVSRDRDLIWSAALDAYESGEIWRLTKEEEDYLQKINMSYNDGDIWDSDITERLPLITKNSGNHTYVILADVANKILNIPTDRQTRDVKNRIAAMLRYEGFENGLIYIEGIRTRVWKKIDGTSEQSQPSSVPRCVPPSNQDTVTHPPFIEHIEHKNIGKTPEISLNPTQSQKNNFELNQEKFESGVPSVPKSSKLSDAAITDENQSYVPSEIGSLDIKKGDRVHITKYKENGTVDAIYRNDPPRPHTARVIRDSGKPCLLDILPDQYKLITNPNNAN